MVRTHYNREFEGNIGASQSGNSRENREYILWNREFGLSGLSYLYRKLYNKISDIHWEIPFGWGYIYIYILARPGQSHYARITTQIMDTIGLKYVQKIWTPLMCPNSAPLGHIGLILREKCTTMGGHQIILSKWRISSGKWSEKLPRTLPKTGWETSQKCGQSGGQGVLKIKKNKFIFNDNNLFCI